MLALRIVVLCFMACGCTALLIGIVNRYYLIWNKATFVLYCLYVLSILFCTIVFWNAFFYRIAPYIR